MRLSRFFVDQPLTLGQHDLPEAQAHYIGRVLRHATGDAVQLFDGSGREYLGELVEVGQTEKIFSQPQDKRTEDYITGRFG